MHEPEGDSKFACARGAAGLHARCGNEAQQLEEGTASHSVCMGKEENKLVK